MRVSRQEYLSLPLRAHTFLADVPLHDVSAVDLPGGGHGRTLSDLRAILPLGDALRANPLVRGLFRLRWFLGDIFGWDRAEPGADSHSYIHHLTDDDRRRSVVTPGSSDGMFRALYAFPTEAVSELRNRTVHGFICSVLKETEAGYRLYWGVYVQPVSRITRWYMLAIAPFRRFLVYPAILGAIRRAWVRHYAQQATS